jgi:hypothetical protein
VVKFEIIDRRVNPRGKSMPSRHRFIKRHDLLIREAIRRCIDDTSITDRGALDREIRISSKDLHEPTFHHGLGGDREEVYPGNKEYTAGDKLPKPISGASISIQQKRPGDEEEDFVFVLTGSEWDELWFEDLELPPMVKKVLTGSEEMEFTRDGFMSEGPPSKLDIVQSIRRAQPRRRAIRAAKTRKINSLVVERELIETIIMARSAGGDTS